VSIPHFDQWVGDWAMEPDRFMASYNTLMGLDLHVHLQTGPERAAAAAREQSQQVTAGQIAIVGLMKSVPSGEQGTSTVIARRKIRAAAQDPEIAAIMLHIDSPGGTVSGTEALAADIAAARKRKPVYAYIEDLGASAAYWLASQADKIFANGSGLVGSIGTYMVVHDVSGMAAMKGVKVHVIRAGEMKGQGEPGTEISAALLAEWQGRVTERNEFFVRGVAAGRGMSIEKVRALADGRIHIAGQALAKGLIDGVQAFDETMTQLVAFASKKKGVRMDATMTEAVVATAVSTDNAAASGSPAPQGGGASSPQTATPAARPATLAELKAGCPSAGNDFLISQLEANATLDQARSAWMTQLVADKQKLAQEKAELEKAKPTVATTVRKPGAPSVPAAEQSQGSTDSGDAVERYQQLVAEKIKGGMSHLDANCHVARANPELHRSWLLATNGSKKAQRMIAEKYE
jgi:signal peptide peptidase SppA